MDALRILAEAGATLSSSLDYRATLTSVAHVVVPDLADWCVVDMVTEDGSIGRLAVAHKDPRKVAWAEESQRRYPPDTEAPRGVPWVLRNGRPELYPEVTDEMLVDAARDPEHLRIMRKVGFTSVVIVPMVACGRTLGAITFVSAESGGRYGAADLELAEQLASRAAVAVDNARLYGEAQKEIAERRRVEEELARLVSYPELNPNPVMETTVCGEVTYLNPAAREWLPDLEGSGAGHPLLSDLCYVEREIRDSGGHSLVREVRVGEDFYQQMIHVVPGSKLVHIYVTDSTERRRAEDALRESEKLYRSVVEQAAENIFLVDVETRRILQANTAFKSSLGYTDEELGRLTLYDIVAHDRRGIDLNVRDVLEEGSYLIGERLYRRKDGSLVEVEVGASAISSGGKDALCVVAHDISGRKRAQEALQEVKEDERNRIARDLHDGALQDLTYALVEAQVLQAILTEREPGQRLERIVEALRRAQQDMRGAVYDLRLGEERNRPFPQLLGSLVEQHRRMDPDLDIRLYVEAGFPTAPLGTTGTELLRVFQEALTNARRHSRAHRVLVSLGMEGEELVAEVADDGRGFGPGITSGIGLKSMRERISSLDGTLKVESEPGEGTRVLLRASIPGLGV